jgi:hypothetical protein
MAGTDANITWIALSGVRDLVADAFLSPIYVETWAKERLIPGLVAGRIRWRMRAAEPPDKRDGFWQLVREDIVALLPSGSHERKEAKERLKPAQELCRRIFQRLFPNGRVPDEVELSTTSLRAMIEFELEREAKETGKKPHPTPSWDTVNAARPNRSHPSLRSEPSESS